MRASICPFMHNQTNSTAHNTLSLYFHVIGYRPLLQIRFTVISLLVQSEHSQCLYIALLSLPLINTGKQRGEPQQTWQHALIVQPKCSTLQRRRHSFIPAPRVFGMFGFQWLLLEK